MVTPQAIKRNRLVVPLACVAVVALILISEISYWKAIASFDQLTEIKETRTQLLKLRINLLEAETGQRGYLLTGHKEYLQPYFMYIKLVEAAIESPNPYLRKDPASEQLFEKFAIAVNGKLTELALGIRLHEEKKGDASRNPILDDIGQERTGELLVLGERLLEQMDLNFDKSKNNFYMTHMLRRIITTLLSVISLLAVILFLRQAFLMKKQQQELQNILRIERARLELEVSERTTQLTDLTRHLLNAREDERHRLARNLHDDLGALLTSAKLDAARIKSRLADKAPEALDLLAHLVNMLDSSITLGRDIIEDLRPSALSNLGLVATLEILVREFSAHSDAEVHSTIEPVPLKASAELMVFRLVQESLTNISKYACASHVWVNLASRDGQVEVSLRDDGVGFDTTAQASTSYGLLGMRFRVEAEGGTLSVLSAPGQGTLIQATLPA